MPTSHQLFFYQTTTCLHLIWLHTSFFICFLCEDVEARSRLKETESYHKFDGVEEALVELAVLEIVLGVVCAVHHATRAAGGRSKLLLACVLVGDPVKLHTQAR